VLLAILLIGTRTSINQYRDNLEIAKGLDYKELTLWNNCVDESYTLKKEVVIEQIQRALGFMDQASTLLFIVAGIVGAVVTILTVYFAHVFLSEGITDCGEIKWSRIKQNLHDHLKLYLKYN
jgi:hypothetical protein